MGAGVVGIGLCYGVQLTKDEAWMLTKQFITAAGFWFTAMTVGTKLMSALLETRLNTYIDATRGRTTSPSIML